jgi:ribosome-binding ATPase YchF (GTP1/OBG family)
VTLEMTEDERKLVKSFFLLSSKPCIFACNVAENDLAAASNDPDNHPFVGKVREYVKHAHEASAVVVSAAIESELTDLSDEEAKAYLADIGVTDSGVSRLIKGVYDLLGLQTYLTTGEKETRAWTIVKGMKAPQAAGVIHGDFERGFIAGEIVHYNDLVELGSNAKCQGEGQVAHRRQRIRHARRRCRRVALQRVTRRDVRSGLRPHSSLARAETNVQDCWKRELSRYAPPSSRIQSYAHAWMPGSF